MNQEWQPQKQNPERPQRFLNLVRTGLILMAFWSVLGAVSTYLDLWLIQWLERHTQTFFFELRGSVSPPENIVILAIDEQSLSAAEKYQDDPEKQTITKLMRNWPWQRTAYAEVVKRLMAAGAKSVSADILFDLPSGYGDADDQQLRQTLAQYKGRVILAAAYLESPGPQGATIELFQPNPIFQLPPTSLGLVNYLPPEADGRIHYLPSVYREQFLRPLGLETLPSFAEVTLQASQLSYPQPKGSDIFFYGSSGNFKRIPFWQVLADDWWDFYLKEKTFKDKIVLIGTTTEAAGLSDQFRTPFAEKMPGVEMHAHVIATLLEGKSIREAFPSPFLRSLSVFTGVMVVGIFLRTRSKRPVTQLFWGLGLAISWLGVSYLAFTYAQLILPTAAPVLAITFSSLSYFTMGVIRDQLEKFRLRRTLERYVAAPVVQAILKQPDDFQSLLKGHRLKAAVLFSDVRGFTTLSYQLSPEQLVEQLNAYFHAMVEVIIEAGGTLDKFIGDAVMAEFGFPMSQGEKADAMNAIRAALGMRKALAQLRQKFHQRGQLPFFNGIGINFGEVIAGDIGSLRRSEYAVIGDAVNVASRVEGMTKNFTTDILITESLYQLVAEEVEVICMGEHPLKGREENLVRLYSLVGLKGDDPTFYHQIIQELSEYLAKPE